MAGPAPRPRPGPRPPGCPRVARPRATWQFASSSPSSLRPWPPQRTRSPSLSTASSRRKRLGPRPSSAATRSMTVGGCLSPSWTRGSTPGLRACRCGSRRGPGRGGAGGLPPGRERGGDAASELRRPKPALRPRGSRREEAEGPTGGGVRGAGGRAPRLGPDPGPDKRGWSGRPGPPVAQEAPSYPGASRPGPSGFCPAHRLLPRVPRVLGTNRRVPVICKGGFYCFVIHGSGGWEGNREGANDLSELHFYCCRSGGLVWGGIVYLETRKPAFKKITRSTSGIVSSGSFMYSIFIIF